MAMDWQEGKGKFIQTWGALGTSWGVNRTMAQVHALLMIAPQALSAEEVMNELKISSGNANMNLRALLDWGLIHKELKPGDRRDYFIAEKDMGIVVKQIILNRRKKELEPMLKVLDQLSGVPENCENAIAFNKAINDIKLFSSKADATLEMLMKAESNWIVGTFLKMIK